VAESCAKRNPLIRSGLTQDGRRRAELATDYFLPDERDLPDLVLFGQRFARHIQFYDAGNTKAGDWSVFFESDVTASLSALVKLPVTSFRSFQLDLEKWLKAEPGRDPAQLAAHARLVFYLPVVLLAVAGRHHARLPNDHPLRRDIIELAGRDLADALAGLIAWYRGAITVPGAGNAVFADTALAMADYNLDGAGGDDRVRLSATVAGELMGQPKLADVAVPAEILGKIAPGTWGGLYGATAADTAPYVDAVGMANQRYEQIYDALSYNLLTTAAERVYQGMERIRRDSAAHLTASLEMLASHTPHYGLWLAFLQLFERAKGELNKFTARHLDYYFRDVLRMDARAAQPDHVHLLFELAKGRSAHLLSAGTLFRAGKDALGKPVSYALRDDIVVNRASVAQLRGLRIDTTGTAATAQTPRSALVVASRDGLGEVDLAEDDPSWPPFGPEVSPAARVGFAIADRKLFLREGTRTICIRAELAASVATDIAPRWRVGLTSDKGWFELTGTAQIKTTLNNHFTEPSAGSGPSEPSAGKGGRAEIAENRQSGTRRKGHGFFGTGRYGRKPPSSEILRIIEFTISLSPDDPPVIPLDAELHGTEHTPGVPVVEITFDFDAATTARAFAALRDIRAKRVTLRTEASGLKNLMVFAGGGVADIAKPFAPFGAQPRARAPFVIGSSEIFSKPVEAWRLKLDWETPYTTTGFFCHRAADRYNPNEEVLANGRWVPLTSAVATKTHKAGKGSSGINRPQYTDIHLGETSATVNLASAALIDGLTEQTLDNLPLEATSVNGFMRLRLPRDFGHAAYVTENTRALVGLAGGASYTPSTDVNTVNGLPCAPYNPVLTRIEAACETPREPVESFSLLHPFGISAGSDGGRLFPNLPFEGALLIGVADFEPPARLTLLVQVSDGSGDPLKMAPALEFAYLAGDAWQPFAPRDVDNKTRNFTTSGVLGLNLPEQADTGHTVLPAGLHWIRIAVPRDADALNRLLSVDAQAARASFVDAGNAPAFLETPLAAGSIAKLLVPDLAIKKITQPYSSFDGRPPEQPDAFATRVSERLRHKDRAVTLFDYEALVLEAFPRLHRVKCLNTAELMRDGQNVIVADNELMPGAVTVVTVPWTHARNIRNPLRPYTDQATLTAVDAFLRKRISPFVRLEVQNPKFEEVKVEFLVQLMPEIGDTAFYADALNKSLVEFLTPWARPEGGEITFGGKLWKSTIIDFVEEQPQVDYVTDFRLYHKVDIDAPDGGWTPVDVEVIEATTARSILVSAASHEIHELPVNV